MAKRPSKRILEALADLAKAFQRIEAPSMVIGGIAVIAHGVARQTVGDRIDLQRVRAFVHEFSQILGAPERIPEFERLLQKVLGPDA